MHLAHGFARPDIATARFATGRPRACAASARVRRIFCAALSALLLPVAAADAPPRAPSTPVNDTYHDVVVPDPYRNLEDMKNPETLAWLRAQGRYAEQALAQIDGRDAIVRRVQVLANASGDVVRGVLRMPGNRVYYLKRRAGENQFVLFMRTGPGGRERALVDPGVLTKATGVPHAINYFVPSWDGKTLAYGMSAGGSEDASLHRLDIASGTLLGAPIPRVAEGAVHWSPDSRHLTYNQLRALPADAPDTEKFLDTTVYVLARGAPEASARPVFGPLVNRDLKLERLDVGEVMFAPGSRYMLARTTDTTLPEGRLYVAPVAALNAAKAIAWQALATAADKITDVQLRADTVYLRTYAGAPRGRVLALRLAAKPASPRLAAAVEVVAEPAEGVLQSFGLGRDAVFTEVKQGFASRVRRHAPGVARAGVDVAPRSAGSTFLVADAAHAYREPWVGTSSWVGPSRILAARSDGSTADTGLRTGKLPPDVPETEVSEVLVTSHDGAKVPMAILHRKGLVLDGSNPTLLVGYGAYGFSFEANFDPRRLAWLERGGVLAFANVRGSSAFGDAWYRAGFKATKPNTWKDGVACARYLIAQKYASPATLGIWGTSAGGIFVGRAVTSAPELFAAAIFDVAMLDAVRAETSANGITNISEFGTTADPTEFAALLEMSTYHHIEDGTAYPAVLLIHGMNDPRVDVWNSAKTAARLQVASRSGKPVLLRLDEQAGHGVGSTAQQAQSQQADIFSFLLWQFGKAGAKP